MANALRLGQDQAGAAGHIPDEIHHFVVVKRHIVVYRTSDEYQTGIARSTPTDMAADTAGLNDRCRNRRIVERQTGRFGRGLSADRHRDRSSAEEKFSGHSGRVIGKENTQGKAGSASRPERHIVNNRQRLNRCQRFIRTRSLQGGKLQIPGLIVALGIAVQIILTKQDHNVEVSNGVDMRLLDLNRARDIQRRIEIKAAAVGFSVICRSASEESCRGRVPGCRRGRRQLWQLLPQCIPRAKRGQQHDQCSLHLHPARPVVLFYHV